MAMQGLTRKRRWIWLNLSHGGDPSRQFGGKSWRSSWKHLKTIRLQYIGFGWIIGDFKWSKIQWQCAEWVDPKNDQVCALVDLTWFRIPVAVPTGPSLSMGDFQCFQCWSRAAVLEPKCSSSRGPENSQNSWFGWVVVAFNSPKHDGISWGALPRIHGHDSTQYHGNSILIGEGEHVCRLSYSSENWSEDWEVRDMSHKWYNDAVMIMIFCSLQQMWCIVIVRMIISCAYLIHFTSMNGSQRDEFFMGHPLNGRFFCWINLRTHWGMFQPAPCLITN